MYTTKFGDFNSLKGNIIMDEETTLKVLLSNEFDQNVPKEFQNITPDKWARYAFENNKEYIVTYYKAGNPYVTVSNTMVSIRFSYYEYRDRVLKEYMHIWFKKGYIDKTLKNAPFLPFNDGKIFLGQIKNKSLSSTLIFYPQKKENNVFLEEFIEEDGKTQFIEQYGTADLSKNWFDAPKHYLDYEYLLDYQKLFEYRPKDLKT